MYGIDGFAYSKGELASWQYAMLNGMTDALELGHPLNTVYLLELWVDKAIGRIDRWLKSVKMG